MVLAAMLTVAALPFLWSAKRDQAVGSDATIGALTPAGGLDAGPTIGPALDVLSPHLVEPAFLGGTGTTLAPQPIQYDVVAARTGTVTTGLARYKRFRTSQAGGVKHPCGTNLAPFGTRIVVTNTDNGFRLECTNRDVKPLAEGTVLLLDTDSFGELADLAEAPIPVELSW